MCNKLFFLLASVSVVAGCCYECREKITYPSPPQEIRRQIFVYPDDPPVLNFSQFTETLNFLSEQITVLYIIDTHGTYRLSQIQCLIDIQKKFYRYGVYVLLIDLRGGGKWNELTNMLRKNRANFPAVNFRKSDLPRLYSYLKSTSRQDYALFIIDDKNEQVKNVRDLRCRNLKKIVKKAVE